MASASLALINNEGVVAGDLRQTLIELAGIEEVSPTVVFPFSELAGARHNLLVGRVIALERLSRTGLLRTWLVKDLFNACSSAEGLDGEVRFLERVKQPSAACERPKGLSLSGLPSDLSVLLSELGFAELPEALVNGAEFLSTTVSIESFNPPESDISGLLVRTRNCRSKSHGSTPRVIVGYALVKPHVELKFASAAKLQKAHSDRGTAWLMQAGCSRSCPLCVMVSASEHRLLGINTVALNRLR